MRAQRALRPPGETSTATRATGSAPEPDPRDGRLRASPGGYQQGVTQIPDEPRDPRPLDDPPVEQPLRADDDPLRGSRTSGFWAAVVGLGLLLLLLIIFIAQNTRRTTVSFLAWDGQVPV
ncbi:MAG: hypothetical protein JWM84_2577, partial [Nocardioides sp.]|nr:hypothetical protein [Nocardioides sp.]